MSGSSTCLLLIIGGKSLIFAHFPISTSLILCPVNLTLSTCYALFRLVEQLVRYRSVKWVCFVCWCDLSTGV